MGQQTIDPKLRAYTILAASIIAGKDATEQAVTEQAVKIANRLSAGSAINAAFDRIDKRDENTSNVKTFRATIIGIDKEVRSFDADTGEEKPGSTRGVILLKTNPSTYHRNGQEFARTERTDSAEGNEMAKLAQSLIGHQVTIALGIEELGTARVRVVRSITDNGPDPEFNPNDPRFSFDYDELDKDAKNAMFRRRLARGGYQSAA